MSDNLSPSELEEFYQQKFEQSSADFPNDVGLSDLFTKLIEEWKTVGFPTPKNLTPCDIPGFDDDQFDYLDGLLSQVEQARQNLLVGELPPVKVGPMNNGILDAFNQPAMLGNGYLILIDTGLLSFTYLAGKILLEATPVYLPENGSKSAPATSNKEDVSKLKGWRNETLSSDDMISHLDELVANSVTADPRISSRIPFTKDYSAEFSPIFSEACTRFIIAHEMGHAIAREIDFPFELSDEENMNPEVAEEFKCDWFAMNVIIEHYKKKTEKLLHVNDLTASNMEVISPLVFFDLMFCYRLKKDFSEKNNVLFFNNHPPDIIRKNFLIKTLCEEMNDSTKLEPLLDAYKVMAQHISRYSGYLISEAEKDGIDVSDIHATWNY